MLSHNLTYIERAALREDGVIRQSDDSDKRAALARARAALKEAQAVVLSIHRTMDINLVDAVSGLETALADVDFEEERL